MDGQAARPQWYGDNSPNDTLQLFLAERRRANDQRLQRVSERRKAERQQRQAAKAAQPAKRQKRAEREQRAELARARKARDEALAPLGIRYVRRGSRGIIPAAY